MPESRIARADRRTTAFLVRIGDEIRTARNMAGLTLAETGRAAGLSRSEASRIERGESPRLTVAILARMAAVVGLDLWIRAFPGTEPLRDHSHLVLADAFRRLATPPLVVRSEVRIGDRRDLRAWDLTLTDVAGRHCGVELETRFVDAQAQHRRISQKLADSGSDLVLVVVADTRANRAAVRAAAGYLGAAYAIDDQAAFEALRAGRLPPRSALIFVRVPRTVIKSRPTGASDARRPDRTAISSREGSSARVSRARGGSRASSVIDVVCSRPAGLDDRSISPGRGLERGRRTLLGIQRADRKSGPLVRVAQGRTRRATPAAGSAPGPAVPDR